MIAGAEFKTTSRIFRVWWPSEGDKRDFQFYGDVGRWVDKTEKTLSRQPIDKCCKLTKEEFPYLSEVEVRDYSGRMYRL